MPGVGSVIAAGAANGFLLLPGVTGQYASAPDSAALSITGSLTLDVNVQPVTWLLQTLVGKWNTNQFSYLLHVSPSGQLQFFWSTNGTAFASMVSNALGFIAGEQHWVRVSFVVDDGAGNHTARFYKSTDGSTWTQIGSTVTAAGVLALFDSTALLEIGTESGGTSNPVNGGVYEVKVYNSALGSGSGTPVFDANFALKPFGANSFTESSANAATVTVNGTKAQQGDGRNSFRGSMVTQPAMRSSVR